MKTIADVRQLISESQLLSLSLPSNAVALHYIFMNTVSQGKKKDIHFKAAAEVICAKFNINSSVQFVKDQLRAVLNKYKRLVSKVDKNWDGIVSFLREGLTFPTVSSEITAPSSFNIGSAVCPTSELEIKTPEKISELQVVTPVKTRTDCDKCPSVKKLTFSLKKSLTEEKQKNFRIRSFSSKIKKSLKVRETKQKLKRHEEKIDFLKRELRNSDVKASFATRKLRQFGNKIDDLKKQNALLESHQVKITKKLLDLEDKNKILIKENNSLEKVNQYLLSQVEENGSVSGRPTNNEHQIQTKTGKSYSYEIRRCVYQQLLCDVPIKNCGTLLGDFFWILQKQRLKDTPGPTSCAYMAYELGVLSSIMLAEFCLDRQNLTLSWDATTIGGAHVNEVHVTADKSECLVLDIAQIPGGKTADYVAHIITALKDCASTYARFKQQPLEGILTRIKKCISATLTDRAAVNACVTKQLRDELDSQLLMLNCNVHPLDSIARQAKTNLMALDKAQDVQGHCFGKEGSAANIINAVSTLRFKDGTGDPLGFKNFLRMHGLKISTFVRYVGNRIHVLFHLAGIILRHHDILVDFIEKQCTAACLLRVNILKDLKNPVIMSQVWALGILGKILTGPWMTRFYSSKMSNLEIGSLVQQCVVNIHQWIEDPTELFHPHRDAFGSELQPDSDEVLSSLCLYSDGTTYIQNVALKTILQASLDVIKRQMKDFIDGPFAFPSSDSLVRSASAPTHNMASERSLGCLDKMWRRAPCATVGFLTGKVKCKMNKTLDWLDQKNDNDKKSLVKFSISEAREERVRQFAKQKGLLDDICDRRKEVANQRQVSKKKALARDLKK